MSSQTPPDVLSIVRDEIGDRASGAVERARQLLAKLAPDVGALIGRTRLCKVTDLSGERYVLGVVLQPGVSDLQGDVATEEEVRKTAHAFMERYQAFDLMHIRPLDNREIRVLESYIAPSDLMIAGQHVIQGSWLLGARILSDSLWAKVKSGDLNGWSPGGSYVREPLGAAR